ncbi:MAG: NifU family protein [Bdellovibrionales bacterium]|nr:NifU family protein [Bdellovibrionales bacterium]
MVNDQPYRQKPVVVDIIPTPNPQALKFVLNWTVKEIGSSNYSSPKDAAHNRLALKLFSINGINQIHIFRNSITITKSFYSSWEELEEYVTLCLQENIRAHYAGYQDPNPELERRNSLSKELQEIEEILDVHIRPALQADGGDLKCLSYIDHILLLEYQGACGNCPSATTGTLQAIISVLRAEYDPEIEVFIAPDEN